MIASELITYDIPPLKISESGEKALGWIEEFKVSEIPIIDKGKYLGLIKENDILDRNDLDEPIKNYNLSYQNPFAYAHQHLFEIIALIVENNIDILPVVDPSGKYLGIITIKSVLAYFSKAVSISNQGSIVTLELNIRDYSLAEISKLVESDNAKILASFITSHPDSTKLEVTLKINKTEITRILHTFERFDYVITGSYNETEYHEDLKSRYDAFLRFLNP